MRIPCAPKVRGKVLVLAAIFHLLITLGLFSVGRLGLAPTKIDRDGIGEFARDGRVHLAQSKRLAELLSHGELRAWLNDDQPLHVKVYSISVLLFGFFLGASILTIEPLNLLYYLGVIEATFRLGQVIAGSRAARVATIIVALWPSMVLHSTQFLRDPLVIISVVALISFLALLLKKNLNWSRAAICAAVGVPAVWLACNARPEIWLVIVGVNFIALVVFLARMISRRRLLLTNLAAVVLLNLAPVAMPRQAEHPVSQHSFVGPSSQSTSVWNRLYLARDRFILGNVLGSSGSIIDNDVVFTSPGDVIRYVPRALEIGYLAPFPTMWLRAGNNSGLAGRLLGGLEMTVTYLLEVLALVYVWRTRRRLSTWFVFLATLIGMLALGLVVNNIGTLYRMRYPFWIPIVVMGTATLITLRKRQTLTAK